MKPSQIKSALTAYKALNPLSLDQPLKRNNGQDGKEGNEVSLFLSSSNQENPEDVVVQRQLRQRLEYYLVDALSSPGEMANRRYWIIRLRLGLVDGKSHTLEEVGQKLGITGEWARREEIKAYAILREYFEKRNIIADNFFDDGTKYPDAVNVLS